MTAGEASPSAVRRSTASDPAHAARRQRTARRLVIAVERLLLEQTFPELSVDQIVAEAGISRSTFYNYFEDKSDLLGALTADAMASIIEVTGAWWSLPADAPKEDVREAIEQLVGGYVPHAALMLAVADSIPHDANVREAFQSFMALGVEGIAGYIGRGQEAGALRDDLDATAAAHWLAWMMERGLSKLGRPDGDLASERIIASVVDILWKSTHA